MIDLRQHVSWHSAHSSHRTAQQLSTPLTVDRTLPRRDPNRALAAALVYGALCDCGLIRERQAKSDGSEEYADALIWLFVDESGGMLSCRGCCDMMGLSYENVVATAFELLPTSVRKQVTGLRLSAIAS